MTIGNKDNKYTYLFFQTKTENYIVYDKDIIYLWDDDIRHYQDLYPELNVKQQLEYLSYICTYVEEKRPTSKESLDRLIRNWLKLNASEEQVDNFVKAKTKGQAPTFALDKEFHDLLAAL